MQERAAGVPEPPDVLARLRTRYTLVFSLAADSISLTSLGLLNAVGKDRNK